MTTIEERAACHQQAGAAFQAVLNMREDIGEIKGIVTEIKCRNVAQDVRIETLEQWRNQTTGAMRLAGKVLGIVVPSGLLSALLLRALNITLGG